MEIEIEILLQGGNILIFKDFSKPIETPDDIKVATITYIQH